jgi:hypothetical protein
MRYALRKKDKIASAYSEQYLNDHIIQSLNRYFSTHNDSEIAETIEIADKVDNINYPILRINDVADDNCMLEFAVLGQTYDVIKLSFLGRMKG